MQNTSIVNTPQLTVTYKWWHGCYCIFLITGKLQVGALAGSYNTFTIVLTDFLSGMYHIGMEWQGYTSSNTSTLVPPPAVAFIASEDAWVQKRRSTIQIAPKSRDFTNQILKILRFRTKTLRYQKCSETKNFA